VAGVQRAVLVVDFVAKLAQGGAVRVLRGAGATAATRRFIGGAQRDATIERFGARISVALMANFVALVRHAAAGVGLVTQPTEHLALELELGGSPMTMNVAALPRATTAGAAATAAAAAAAARMVVVIVVVAAARKHK
jgi:hypothetical protein